MTTNTNNQKKFRCPCLNWNPDDFKAMFEKMTEGWSSKEGPACCQGVMEERIKEMMKMCCETKPVDKPE